MYSEQWLIDLLKAETGYTDIEPAPDTVLDQISEPMQAGQPRIYVGHLGIKLQNPQQFEFDTMSESENAEVLTTAIQFICFRDELPAVRQKLKDAYTGKTPFAGDENFGTIGFLEGGVAARTNTKIIWQEIVGFIIPRIS